MPDLVINRDGTNEIGTSATRPPDKGHDSTNDPATTEDEGDAVDALLSLGSDLSNTVNSMEDMLNENAALMPIGAPAVQDVNPVDINLDQVSVDKTIAAIIDQEQAAEVADRINKEPVNPTVEQDNVVPGNGNDSDVTIPALDDTEALGTSSPKTKGDLKGNESTTPKGKVEIKEYSVKRKVSDGKLKFVCPKCMKRFKSRREQNKHYRDNHDPIICSDCDKVFTNPASLSIHMYDHMDKRFVCEFCNRGFHFQGQLTQHKVVHRKEGKGTFQCMTAKCGKWFIHKGDLVVHLESHKKKDWKCPHCDHITTCEKYLKTHIKSHHETDESEYPYKCAVCDHKFLYRTQLSHHKETHLKALK